MPTQHDKRRICSVPESKAESVNAVLQRHGFGPDTFSVRWGSRCVCDIALSDCQLSILQQATATVKSTVTDAGGVKQGGRRIMAKSIVDKEKDE